MKILIVDNNPSTVLTLKALLLEEGRFEIDSAFGGKECLAKLTLDPTYDVVLLDIMMPEFSGMDVCEAMVKDPKLKNIPVLLMSSAVPIPAEEFNDSLGRSGKLAVVKGVLEKPFVIQDLLAQIYEVTGKRL